MNIVWDEVKRERNVKKHKVDFVEVADVLYDEYALTTEDADHKEQRFITLGANAQGKIYLVCYGYHEDNIRIISAREADRKQVRDYEQSRFQ